MKAIVLPCTTLLLACSGPDQGPGKGPWSALPNGYATHFELQMRGEDRRLLVFGPGGKADTIGCYWLQGAADGACMTIPDSLQNVAVLSTTHLAYFAALGELGLVKGIAHTDRVMDARFLEAVRTGAVQELARAEGVDRERLLALSPQLVFDHPFGGGEGSGTGGGNTVCVAEYLEEHPLGRAEWIRFFGILLGKEALADSAFAAIEHRYGFLRDQGRHIPQMPTVLFGSHWNGAWYVPPGNSYMATLLRDAGGRYSFADSSANGNIALPLERLIVTADTVDHLGVLLAVPGRVDALALVGGDPRLAALPSVRVGGFQGNSARHDLFGQALLEPDVVLRDLRCILHPATCSGHVPRYFTPLDQ